MNQLEHLLHQVDYVIWADNASLAAAATVPAENYNRDYGFSFRSVHGVLFHLLSGQAHWLNRWPGNADLPIRIDAAAVTTLDAVRANWVGVHAALRSYVAARTPESLEAYVEFSRDGVPQRHRLWKLITHCLDHATYHRGQLNSLVKLAGGTPGELGMFAMLRQQAGKQR